MFSFLKKQKDQLVGIDVGSSAVKLVEFSRQDEGEYSVQSYATVPLARSDVSDKNLADAEAIGAAIRLAVTKSGTKAKNAAIAVPGSAAITKNILMPADLSDDDMLAQLEAQADQHVPYPLEEVSMDFHILGPSKHSEEEVEVLLAATRNEYVEERVKALELGGLNPTVVDVETHAIENIYPLLAQQVPNEGVDKTVAVVDIGASVTTVYVVHDKRVIFTREQVYGGQQLTQEILDRYGLNYDDAEKAKKNGGLPDNYEPELLNPFMRSLVQQVNRAMNYFYTSSQFTEVDHVVIGGGGSVIPLLPDLIGKALNATVSIANPFTRMMLASRVSPHALSSDAPLMLTACGLAMRTFD